MSENHVHEDGPLGAASRPGGRPPTTDLREFSTELQTIAADLKHSAHILQQGPNDDVVGDMRCRLSRAGRLLLHLMLKGVLAPPNSTTTWLQWRTPGTRRPRFSGLRYKGNVTSTWQPAKRLRQVAINAQIYQPARKTGTPRTFFETPAETLDRFVFVEAMAGWLGNRCSPRVRCRLPVCEVQLAGHGAEDGWVCAPIDVAATPEREHTLFLDLGRAAATVCRYLASMVESFRETQDDAIDWTAHENSLSTSGDTAGRALLDRLRAARKAGSRITNVQILDALSHHKREHQLYADLQPDLDFDASTSEGVCERWRLLSAWAERFGAERNGALTIHWGWADGQHGPVSLEQLHPRTDGSSAPELTWARTWRDATKALIRLAVQHGVEDKPLHQVVQAIDRILAGERADVGKAVRDAELTCGAVEARLPFASDHVKVHGVTGDNRPPTPEPPRLDDPAHGLGHGGPARTLTAAGRVILAGRRPGIVLAAGDETTLKAAVARMPENEAKKARDYLAPSGKLVQGGWIERDGLRVIFTAKGAEAAMRRIRRDDERRRPR